MPAQQLVAMMSDLDSIPVSVQGPADADTRTRNLQPLLQQVEQALQELVDDGRSTVIDLAAMPFSSQDEAELRDHLGKGEVSATLDTIGLTLVEETGLPGVWLVEHKDTEDRRLTLHLEVTRIPQILVVPAEDIAEALLQLKGAERLE